MYSREQVQLGGFFDDAKKLHNKVRKAIHKVIPRELSPTRLLDKYVADTKKKNAAKVAKTSGASERANIAADAATSARIATLQLQALPAVTSFAADQPTFEASPPAKVKKPFDATPYLWLGAFALAGALYVIRKRR